MGWLSCLVFRMFVTLMTVSSFGRTDCSYSPFSLIYCTGFGMFFFFIGLGFRLCCSNRKFSSPASNFLVKLIRIYFELGSCMSCYFILKGTSRS